MMTADVFAQGSPTTPRTIAMMMTRYTYPTPADIGDMENIVVSYDIAMGKDYCITNAI